MMRMLDWGGIEVMTDGLGTADSDNPNGYFEMEGLKKGPLLAIMYGWDKPR